MAVDFASFVRQDDVAVFAYAYISGIGNVFSNIAQPSAWTLGTDYTWDRSLVFFRSAGGRGVGDSSIDVVSQSVTVETGVMPSGDMELEFAVDPEAQSGTWVDYLLPTTRLSWEINPEAIHTPSDNAIALMDTTGATATQLYAGLETFNVLAVNTSAKLLLMNPNDDRGYFGSRNQWYAPRGLDASTHGGPMTVTSWPDTWKGRTVEVWLGAASVGSDGSLTPLDTAPKGVYSKQIFRGPIYDQEWGDGYASVRFIVQSLSQQLEKPAAFRGRKYRPGPSPDGKGWVYIETGGIDRVEYSHAGRGTEGIIVLTETIASGTLISGAELGNVISDMLEQALDVVPNVDYYSIAFDTVLDSDTGEERGRFYQRARGAATAGELTLRVKTAIQPHASALPALGFSDDVKISGISPYRALSPDPIPHYMFGRTSTHLYYHGQANEQNVTADPPYEQGTIRRDGTVDGCYVKLGKSHIVEGRFRDAAGTINGSVGGRYIEIARNGVCATLAKPWIVPYENKADDDQSLTVGLGFTDHDLWTILRQIAISKGDPRLSTQVPRMASGYDVLPEGFGAGLLDEWFDHATFDDSEDREHPWVNGWFIDAPVSVRTLFQLAARATGTSVISKLTTSGYKIALVPVIPPSLDATADVTIDSDWYHSIEDPVIAEHSERRIINNIAFEYALNPMTGKMEGKNNTFRHDKSIAKFGVSKPLKVKVPWLHTFQDVEQLLTPIAAYLFGAFAFPVDQFEVPARRWEGWNLEISDVVGLTHKFLPNYRDGGFGLTDELMEVQAKGDNFGPGADVASNITLLWRNSDGARYDEYVPGLKIKSLSSGAVYNVEEYWFARLDNDATDISYYATAAANTWKVRAFLPYADNDADYQTRTVSAVDTSALTITLSSALTGALAADLANVVIEFDEYDVAGDLADDQERFAFVADEVTFDIVNASTETRDASRWY